jgi:hypothetical protein
MNRFRQRLAALPPDGCLLTPASSRLLLLTGQSSFRSSVLSPEQFAFLSAVAPPGAVPLDAGFPFHVAFLEPSPSAPGLLAASCRNALQVLWTRYDPAFVAHVAARLQQAAAATSRRLILITGSCGLQLANAAWPALRLPHRLRIDVVALGPASFGPLHVPATVLQGRRDDWSRLLYRGPVHYRPPCGHLDYWRCPDTIRTVREVLR